MIHILLIHVADVASMLNSLHWLNEPCKLKLTGLHVRVTTASASAVLISFEGLTTATSIHLHKYYILYMISQTS